MLRENQAFLVFWKCLWNSGLLDDVTVQENHSADVVSPFNVEKNNAIPRGINY